MVTGGAARRMRRLDALQSLRGLAAAIVLFRHSTLNYPIQSRTCNLLLDAVFNSHAAVVVFFVLSGFVLAASLDQRQVSVAAIREFYIKRLFRILPLLMVITVLSVGFTLISFSALELPGTTPFFIALLEHGPVHIIAFGLGLFGLNSHYVPQNWTIMVELLIAPFFPFMFFLSRARAGGLAALLAIGTISTFAARTGGHWLPVVYANDFVIGIAVFLIWSRRRAANQRRVGLLAAIAFVFLIGTRPILMALEVSFVDLSNFHEPLTGLIEALAAGVIVLALADQTRFSRLLSHPKLVFLGDISFSLYLVHFLIIVTIARILGQYFPDFTVLGGLSDNLILASLVFAFSFAVSILLYRCIELPCNRLGRRLAIVKGNPAGQHVAIDLPASNL